MNVFVQHANELTFAASTVTGMLAHYVKKSVKGETTVNISEWFGSAHLPGSLASIGSCAMVIITALSNGVITPEMAFWPVVYIGITTGFSVDATANSDGTRKTVKESVEQPAEEIK